jgi:hypothetical protein
MMTACKYPRLALLSSARRAEATPPALLPTEKTGLIEIEDFPL